MWHAELVTRRQRPKIDKIANADRQVGEVGTIRKKKTSKTGKRKEVSWTPPRRWSRHRLIRKYCLE